MLPLLKQLKDYIYLLTKEICDYIIKSFEPYKKLNQLNYVLEAHFEDIWLLINLPIKFLEQPELNNEDQYQLNEFLVC